MPFYSRILSTEPKVDVSPTMIVAQTCPIKQFLSLGIFRRKVTFYSPSSIIEIEGRWFWFFKFSREVLFREVKHVMYQHDDGGGFGETVVGPNLSEKFEVGLRLRSGEELPVFSFSGAAEYVNDLATPFDYLDEKWNELTDTADTQQEGSLNFADLLCARLNVTMGF